MAGSKILVHATLVGDSKGPTWYKIWLERPHERGTHLRGPYRDGTEAHNAACEEARRKGLELQWHD